MYYKLLHFKILSKIVIRQRHLYKTHFYTTASALFFNTLNFARTSFETIVGDVTGSS